MASHIQRPQLQSLPQPQSPRTLNDTCFHCRNQGHWAKDCPFKTPTKSPNPNQNPPPSSSEPPDFPPIPCPNGHGSCFVKIARTLANPGRPFYSCSVLSPSGKCGFFKWLDQVKEFGPESNVNGNVKRDRSQNYPDCQCGAGKCEVLLQNDRQYFVCPIRKGDGKCNFRRNVVETMPMSSDGNGENQASHLSPKKTKLASPVVGDPDPASTPVDHIEEIIIDSEECDEILDLSAIQEIALRERALTKEKELQVSCFASEQAVHSRQAEFLRHISAAQDTITDADPLQQFLCTLMSGWLGRLAFPPSGCLTAPQAKPFFCCVFPSYDPISVPTLGNGVHYRHSNDLRPRSCNVQPDLSQQISSPDSQSGVLSELSTIQNVPGIRQGRDFMSQISKSLLEAGLHVQNQLLTILESTDPSNHNSMEEAANKTFAVLNLLSVNHTSFSEHVKHFISRATALADIQESMNSSGDIMERYENEKAKFGTLSRMHSEAEDAIATSDERLKLLRKEASLLKEILLQTENQLRRCEMDNAELKTRGRKVSESMLESEKLLQEAEAAKKLHAETEAKHVAAKEELETAKAQLRNSVITL